MLGIYGFTLLGAFTISMATADEVPPQQRGGLVDAIISCSAEDSGTVEDCIRKMAESEEDENLAEALNKAADATTPDATMDQIVQAAFASSEPESKPSAIVEIKEGSIIPVSEAPLAIPMTSGAGAPPRNAPSSTSTVKAKDRSNLEEIRSYQAHYLKVDQDLNLRLGTAYVRRGWGPYRTQVRIVRPSSATRSWAVYQSGHRLDVPEFFAYIGNAERSNQLTDQVNTHQRSARNWYILSGAGFVSAFYGMNANESAQRGNNVSLIAGGLVAAIVGSAVGSSRASDAATIQTSYPNSLSHEETLNTVDKYNEDLRQELGLSDSEVTRAERKK